MPEKSYLTVVTTRRKRVCLYNAPRPLEGKPVDIGLPGWTVCVTDSLWQKARNAELDATPIFMISPVGAIRVAKRQVKEEYGMSDDELAGITDAEWLSTYQANNRPCRLLDV